MDRHPAAYIRKSRTLADSAAAQLEAVRAVTARDGANGDLVVYSDVGVSGRRFKRGSRSEWARLRDDVEADRVSTVYVSVLDRAGRSIIDWLLFVELLVKHGVRLVDQSGQDRASEASEDTALFEMWMAQKEGKKAVERSARAFRTMALRGDEVRGGNAAPFGHMRARAGDVGADGDPKRVVIVSNPDEDLAPVRGAVAETRGNVLRAARLLNERGVPTRSGAEWNPRTLTRLLDGLGEDRRRQGARGRRRAPSDSPLSRIVECHCGATMTPMRDPRGSGRWLSLTCSPGYRAGRVAHGPYLARSRHVTELLQAELRYSEIRVEKSAPRSDVDDRRAALEARRAKLQAALDSDVIGVEEFRRRAADLKHDVDLLVDVEETDWTGFSPKEPLIDWTASNYAIGDRLRKLVQAVKLGPDMKPASIVWRAPWLARVKASS